MFLEINPSQDLASLSPAGRRKKKTPPVTVGVFRRGENAPLRLAAKLPILSYPKASVSQTT
jgi:hypothetical protein